MSFHRLVHEHNFQIKVKKWSDIFFVFCYLPFTSSELPDPTLIIDPITEERASRTLYRIELLRRIREQVLPHPLLSERLKLCQPSPDLPEWWECGRHDRDLLLGASKHGVSRTDYHILNDPTLAFLEAHQRFTSHRGAGICTGAQAEIPKAGMGAAESIPAPLLTTAELASAAAAAKVAAKEEGEGKEVKTEEGKAELEVKMETEGDANDIPCTKTETPEEQKENEGEDSEGKDETAVSPKKEVKEEEEAQPKVEKEEKEEHKEEHSRDAEKTSKPAEDQDKDLTEEDKTTVDSLGDQKERTTELPEHLDSSHKAQPDHKTAEEEDGEERENPESLKSPKSADTEKSPEEEDEERMDEDDKSEKSSQAEGEEARGVNVILTGGSF